MTTRSTPSVAHKLYEDGTAATHLTRDDPPVFLYYGFPNTPITPDTLASKRAHNPVFGTYLKERMDKAGVQWRFTSAKTTPGPARTQPYG